ncbi:MAG: 3'-5' exonuclease [Myxococcota bacterium]|nr:3'-5' exonuclease [Myxococcota bacterium]
MSENFYLQRPIVSFDLETTGLSVENDRIVEISCVKLSANGREVLTRRVNPERPIPPEAAAIHGITDADVQDAPPFREVADEVFNFMREADLTGFNIARFDMPLLKNEFARLDVTFPEPNTAIVDSHTIFTRREPRNLTAAYRFYCDKTLDNAHSAEPDAIAAADVLMAQLEKYEDLPRNAAELQQSLIPQDRLDPAGKIVWRNGLAVLNFGKNRYRSLKELSEKSPGYLEWMARTGDFSPEVQALVENALKGDFPKATTAIAASPS